MSSADLLSLLEQLDDDIDDLEDAIAPFVAQSLADAGPKLPLLDKAKLYVLVTYAIESMLFCGSKYHLRVSMLTPTAYLRLQGVNAREHPVFQELTRVKQYFDKIKAAEAPADKADNKQVLNTAAAARFIKAGLVSDAAGTNKNLVY